MNWFGRGKEEISESELIAYHLHELPPGRERAVARALAASAALAAEAAAIEATLRAVKDTPGSIHQAAFTRTWQALQPALVPYTKAVPAAGTRWRMPALAGTALALLVGGVVLVRHRETVLAPAVPADGQATAAQAGEAPRSPDEPGNEGAARPKWGGEGLTQLPSTGGLRGSLRTGVFYPHSRTHEAPPVHLLSLAPLGGTPQGLTGSNREGTEVAQAAAVPLTERPVPLESFGRGDKAAGEKDVAAGAGSGGATGKPKPHGAGKGAAQHETDFMVGVGGTFIVPHSSLTAGTELRTLNATKAIAAVGSFHQQYSRYAGYRVTLSYTRPTLIYSYSGAYGQVTSRMYEAAGTYVVRGPHRGFLSTTADAGLGIIALLPEGDPGANYGYSAAALLGVAADVALTKHVSARLQYRAQVLRTPAFAGGSIYIPTVKAVVVSNEPAAGIVYRFGATKR